MKGRRLVRAQVPRAGVGTLADDLVVVLPGIMGSTLIKDGREVWSPSAGSVVRTVLSFGNSVRELTIPPGIGDGDPADGVRAGRLMPDLHVVPGLWSVNVGYDRLLARLRAIVRGADSHSGRGGAPNVLPVPYDWRLSNRENGRRLKRIVEPALERLRAQGGRFAGAGITFVCHSMGGLVARWYVEQEGGWEVTRKVVTIGTPHRGAMNALRDLLGGVQKRFGPIGIDLTAFARSLPSAYELLPAYACVSVAGQLATIGEASLPNLDPDLLAGAGDVQAALETGPSIAPGRAALLPIVGIKQPTLTTATIDGELVRAVETIAGVDERGDATVPRPAATPAWLTPSDPSIHWVAARHGALQHDDAVLDHLEGILTARPVVYRASAPQRLGVRIPDLVFAGDEIPVEAQLDGEPRPPLLVETVDEQGRSIEEAALTLDGDTYRGHVGPLRPGGYVARVCGYGAAVAQVQPVESPLVVWEPA